MLVLLNLLMQGGFAFFVYMSLTDNPYTKSLAEACGSVCARASVCVRECMRACMRALVHPPARGFVFVCSHACEGGYILWQSYRSFRTHIGHHLNEMDAVNHVPLAARICSNDASLSVGVGQAGVYSSIVAYEKYGPIVLVLWYAHSAFVDVL